MTRPRWGIAGYAALAIAVGSVIAIAFFALGTAETGSEVLKVEAAVRLDAMLAFDDGGRLRDGASRRRIQLFLAVTSPSRGAVDQLRTGNVRIYDAYYSPFPGLEEGDPLDTYEFYVPYDFYEYGHPAAEVDFTNLGGGFYRIDVLTYSDWEPVNAVLQIEVICPWGRGITLCEIPVGMVEQLMRSADYW